MTETCDVAIVGAGFAGLSTALELRRRGRSSIVLEARDRVGGRVYTKQLPDGRWVDLGGQWAGPTQDHLLALISQHGIPSFPTWTKGDNLVFVRGTSRRYRGTIPRLDVLSLLNIGWAQWRLESMSKQVPLAAPWNAKNAEAWDRITLGEWLDRHVRTNTARHLLDAGLETVFATSARDMSLLHALFYIHSGKDLDMLLGSEGGAQATRIDGGMQQVAEALAKGSDVRLSSPVRRIEQRNDGVTVHHDAGEVRAARVVVTVPPKLVSKIDFSPALSGRRAELVTKMPMGAVIKCTAFYERPFWRDDRLSGMSVSDEGPIHVVFDNSPPRAEVGVLMGFCEADEARRLGKRTQEERREIALRAFVRTHGPGAKDAIDYQDHVWENDEWAGGCYGAFCPVGVWTRLGSAIREPVGRVHWAGTETAERWSGYIDGAIASGIRVAEEITRAE